MRPLYEDPHFTFRFADDRLIPRFHLEGVEAGQQVAQAIRDSVAYALEHREEALNYALQFARDMDTDLADKFVAMYVNKWTLGYGEKGKRAVKELIVRGTEAGLLPGPPTVEFLSED